MAEKKRQCGTCRFFVESESGGHGKCTHPKRDKVLREMVLLRPNELGCRTKWGTSLWQDPADDSDPFKPETPQQPTLPDPIPAQLQYDDEVTSVSIAGSKSARSSFEDDVVDSGATGSGMGSWNDSAQEERRRLLMNSDRDAVAGARKRHMERQTQQRPLIPFAEEEESESATPEKAEEKPAEPKESVAASQKQFPPDDYVEDERSSNKDEPVYDDELVDEGVGPGSHRSPRMRKLLRDNKSPKNHKAMGLGTPAEIAVESNNPEKREQWNSVPSMTPGFELPFAGSPVREATPPPSQSLRVSASAAPMAMNISQSRPVSQARELLSEDRIRTQRAQRHLDVPMALPDDEPEPAIESEPTVTNRPRLNQAPTDRAAQVDRIKSSPLRGYSRALKEAATRAEENNVAERQPQFRQESRQAAPIGQPRREARPFTSGWNRQAEKPVASSPQVREERQQVRREEPAPMQERREPVRQQSREMPEPDRRPLRRAAAPEMYEEQYDEDPIQEMQQPRKPAVRTSEMNPRPQQRPRVEQPQQYRPDTPFVAAPIQISPDIPRACGTCSSFRPGSKPGRGSCANEFAGPVQRVVSEEDIACQHTYGAFWIPADELVWLEELNNDYPPTPRVDAMLARRRKREIPETVVLPDLEELTS